VFFKMSEYCYTSDPENSRSNGKAKSILVHRKVWRENFGEIPEEMIIHHKNGNKKDNRLENLEMVSRSEHSQKHHEINKIIKKIKKN